MFNFEIIYMLTLFFVSSCTLYWSFFVKQHFLIIIIIIIKIINKITQIIIIQI